MQLVLETHTLQLSTHCCTTTVKLADITLVLRKASTLMLEVPSSYAVPEIDPVLLSATSPSGKPDTM